MVRRWAHQFVRVASEPLVELGALLSGEVEIRARSGVPP